MTSSGSRFTPRAEIARPDRTARRDAIARRDEIALRDEIATPDEPATGYRVDEYLDDELGELVGRWQAELAEEPEVIGYAGEGDEEAIWGPRPKLMADEPGGRRTVVITGRVADRHIAPRASARGSLPVHARHGFAADRTAMWAVLLCVILLLVALTSH